jgi:hypothetical protein
MIIKDRNLVFRILNVWLAFALMLFLVSHLPHWGHVSTHCWLNGAFYFLLFLLALFIAVKEKNNKDIFINLSLYLFVYAISLVNIFIGDKYLLGGGNMMYYYFAYKKMAFSLLLNLVIVYPVVRYLAIIIPVFLLNFHSVVLKPEMIYAVNWNIYQIELYKRILSNNLLGLAFILFYGYLLYKKDKILGEYINLLMACLFIILVTGLMSHISDIYRFKSFDFGQYILTINLIVMCATLLKKLFFINSEFGQFYEALISKKIKLDKIQIKRHRSEANALLIKIHKIYLIQRRKYIITLAVLSGIVFGYFKFPRFFTSSIIAILLCLITLFWFVDVLYKRRARQNHILP